MSLTVSKLHLFTKPELMTIIKAKPLISDTELIILMADAVYLHEELQVSMLLKPDLLARGIQVAKQRQLDYAQLAQYCSDASQVITWN